VSFKNCVIIMTSNLGSAQIFEHLPSDSREDLKARVMAEVKAHFRCVSWHSDFYVYCYFVICLRGLECCCAC
jgi:hypothetical protein